ncbi:MAG: hypothetical protein WCX46_03185 [Candidatus Paceibacterota bacterium]
MENENQNEPKNEVLNVSNNISKKPSTIKTYAEDMQQVIEKGGGAVIRKIIEEEEQKEAVDKNISPESTRNKLFIFISILLILGAVAILFFFFILKEKKSTVEVEAKFTPLIFVDKTIYREIGLLNKDQIVQTILNESTTTQVKSGGIEALYLTENKKVIGLARFISLIKGNLLMDSNIFISDNFLLGVVNKDDKDLFLMLKGRSFLDIFPILKNWESKMFNDLHGLFGIEINAETNYLQTKDFEDGFVNNKNARILRDKDGNIVFKYVFSNDNSVIISNNDEVIKEVISRLISLDIKK